MRRPPSSLRFLASGLLLGFAGLSLADAQTADDPIRQARQLLEAERATEALVLLEPLTTADPPSAEALFLLSNAHFVLGDLDAGRIALEHSIAIDPGLRDAWITLAALDLAEGNYQAALASFRRAQELDPSADDTLINLGATYVLMGDLGNATQNFNGYLSQRRSDSMAYYLVAKNYAIGQYWDLTVQHLEAAITLDEKTRRLARRDPAFVGASAYVPFLTLLATDNYRAEAGSHLATESFGASYDGGHGNLLRAVLNALQFSGHPFDPNVEVTDQWALIWTAARMRLSNSDAGSGQIEFSAPAASQTASEWARYIDELSGQIREQVALLSMRRQ